MKTIILGKKSFLSNSLNKKIKDSHIFSIEEFINKIQYRNINFKFNLIINSFYSSLHLQNINSYSYFFKKSILDLSLLLDKLKKYNINKVIYTSSASVYGSVGNYSLKKDDFNRKLYSSSKLSNEILLSNFCNKNNINLIIARIFNMYGDDENFSFISKIIEAKKNNKFITLFNQGHSVRDFIHISDVIKIYSKFLNNKVQGIFDIGTGIGIKLIDLINSTNFNKKKIIFHSKKIIEIDRSIANTELLENALNYKNFFSLKKYLKKNKFNIKSSLIEKNTDYTQNNLFNNIRGSIIYGAGYAGITLAKSLIKINKNDLYCFVDDDFSKIGKYRFRKQIISFDDLIKISKNSVIPNIIIAIPSLKEEKLIFLYEKLKKICLNVNILPFKNELINKEISINQLKEFDIGEIINRKLFEIKSDTLVHLYRKNILITGAGGSIGSELCIQILKAKPKIIIALDFSEIAIYNLKKLLKINGFTKVVMILGSTSDCLKLNKIIDNYKITHIFHAAAYKHVSILEENIIEAVKNNIFSIVNILNCIKNRDINLIVISTDKAANPKSVLGFTKRISEIICQSFIQQSDYKKLKLSIIRFGNVFGSQGSAIPMFIQQIREGGPITLTNSKVERYFMSIKEACNLVIQSIRLSNSNKIFILQMGSQIKILDIVYKLINFFGKNKDKIKIIETGLNKGEKIKERLSYSNKFQKTKYKNILLIKEKIYSVEKVKNLLTKFFLNIQNNNSSSIYKLMRSFLRSEIK
jgi:FlaA1/EpsC-like NDP-sugar epimerase